MKLYEDGLTDTELRDFVAGLEGYAPLSRLLSEHLTTDCAECLDALMRIYLHEECVTDLKHALGLR